MKNYKGVKVATDEEIKAIMSEPGKPIPVGTAILGKDLLANSAYTEEEIEDLRAAYHHLKNQGLLDMSDERIEEHLKGLKRK